MPPVSITSGVGHCSYQLNERQDYSKVIAYWPDLINAEYSEETEEYTPPLGSTSSGENVHRLPHPYNTQEEAKAAAKSKLDELNRGDASLNMTLLGNA
ncbi:MAG: hypothetical protein V3T17_18130, partial [Pseudomonadales bacterium]